MMQVSCFDLKYVREVGWDMRNLILSIMSLLASFDGNCMWISRCYNSNANTIGQLGLAFVDNDLHVYQDSIFSLQYK